MKPEYHGKKIETLAGDEMHLLDAQIEESRAFHNQDLDGMPTIEVRGLSASALRYLDELEARRVTQNWHHRNIMKDVREGERESPI